MEGEEAKTNPCGKPFSGKQKKHPKRKVKRGVGRYS